MERKTEQSIKTLTCLIKQNPSLRVVTLVRNEDEEMGTYRKAEWVEPRLEEICEKNQRVYFRSKDLEQIAHDEMENILRVNPRCVDSYLQERVEQEMEKYRWEQVILLEID